MSNRKLLFSCLLSLMIGQSNSFADQKSISAPAGSLNPEIKKWHDSIIAEGKKNQKAEFHISDISTIYGRLFDLKQKLKLTDAQWIEQEFLLTLPEYEPDGTGAWVRHIDFVWKNRAFLGNVSSDPHNYLEALSGYIESDDPQISGRAESMLLVSEALIPMSVIRESDREQTKLDCLEDYLKTQPSMDSHRKLIAAAFRNWPTAAFHTMAKINVKIDGAKQAIKMEKELNILLLSLEVADGDHRNELETQISKKIGEMSESSFWCARAFVAAKSFWLPVKVDKSILDKLAKDTDPIVSELAKASTKPK